MCMCGRVFGGVKHVSIHLPPHQAGGSDHQQGWSNLIYAHIETPHFQESANMLLCMKHSDKVCRVGNIRRLQLDNTSCIHALHGAPAANKKQHPPRIEGNKMSHQCWTAHQLQLDKAKEDARSQGQKECQRQRNVLRLGKGLRLGLGLGLGRA